MHLKHKLEPNQFSFIVVRSNGYGPKNVNSELCTDKLINMQMYYGQMVNVCLGIIK